MGTNLILVGLSDGCNLHKLFINCFIKRSLVFFINSFNERHKASYFPFSKRVVTILTALGLAITFVPRVSKSVVSL